MGRWIKKLVILAIIFVAAIGAFIWINRDGETEKIYGVMGEASLPVMRLVYGEQPVNELHGYTTEMEAASIRETIYPLGADCVIPVQVLTFGRQVTGIGYEVRSVDGAHLIERSYTEALEQADDGMVTAEITLMDLLERQTEYLVAFSLYDGETVEARYYTRVCIADDQLVFGAIDFALMFSEKTFMGEPDEEMIAQLESKSGADNSSFGYTDIYSSYSHVLWGELNPEKTGETMISVYEIDRLMTSLSLSFSVTAADENGQREEYDVEEFYSVRYVNGKYYLMTYERQVSQRFATDDDRVTENGSLELGVVADSELPLQIRQQGKYTAFVKDGRLWCYNAGEDMLKTLFTFRDKEDDERTEYSQHDIRIVRMGDSGDVEFIVYGYMNRGLHEGQTGIACYRYLADQDVLEEIFYIPSGQTYQRIKEELGLLSYMNEEGLFYLMYKGTVYAIDLEGGEYVELASGLSPTALSIDAENGIVAWQQKDRDDQTGGSINLYYLETGESRTIDAPEGEYLEMFGFIDGDLLYGLISEEDRAAAYPYSTSYPIHALEIVNMEGQVESRYEQPGVYLTDIEILADRVCFGRRSLAGGSWEELEGDVLFCSDAGAGEEKDIFSTTISERQKKTCQLALGLTDQSRFEYSCPRLLEDGTTELILGNDDVAETGNYYAYSHGKLQGIFSSAAEAIACIQDDMGVVVNEKQEMVWNRGNRGTAAQINLSGDPKENPETADYLNLFLEKLGTQADCSEAVASGENIIRILQARSERTLINLEGCDVSQILYYLYEGVPVLGIDDDNQAVLITGYYEAYGDGKLICYDLETAKTVEISYQKAEERFGGSGNRFISVIP